MRIRLNAFLPRPNKFQNSSKYAKVQDGVVSP